MCVNMFVCEVKQRSLCSPSTLFEAGSLNVCGYAAYSKIAGSGASGSSPVPTSHLTVGVLELQVHDTMSSF